MSDAVSPAAHLTPHWFKPGQSGNPSGRTRIGEKLSAYIRGLGGDDGKLYADQLHLIATSPHRDTKSRLRALEVLLDRGYGKPPQDVNVSGSLTALDPAKLARLSDQELALAADLVAKLVGEE